MYTLHIINKDRNVCVNSNIIEWDIKSGNTSMMYHYDLAPKPIIDKLAALPKKDRVVAIGKLMKKDKDFSKNLEKSFNNIIKEFLEINKIPNENIISIKRDAVYVLNWDIEFSDFGEFVHFIPKNKYVGWFHVNPFEFYFREDGIDVKGMNDTILPLHNDGMLSFIQELFNVCRSSNMNKGSINEFLSEFTRHYKGKQLINDYYREFNSESLYRFNFPEGMLQMDSVSDDDLEFLDISYNYKTLVLPLIRELC